MSLRKLNTIDWRDKIYIESKGNHDIELLKECFIKTNMSVYLHNVVFSNNDNGVGFLFLQVDKDNFYKKDLEIIEWRYTGSEKVASAEFSKQRIDVPGFISLCDSEYHYIKQGPSISDVLNNIKTIDNAPQMIKDLNKIMMDTFGMDISITLNIPK